MEERKLRRKSLSLFTSVSSDIITPKQATQLLVQSLDKFYSRSVTNLENRMTDLKALDALEDEMEDFEDAHPDGEVAFSANEFHAYAETCQE